MQQDIISIDLKLSAGWEDLDNPLTLGKKKKRFSFCSHSFTDLTDKQLRYVFALLSQGFTATEVKAHCLWRWAGLKVDVPFIQLTTLDEHRDVKEVTLQVTNE